jgi:DNA-binding XRE family transcriptional regulator
MMKPEAFGQTAASRWRDAASVLLANQVLTSILPPVSGNTISSDPVSSQGVAMPNTARNAVSNNIIAASGLNPLKAARETRGYTIEELSLTCGLAVGEIVDIEEGKDADPAKLRRIASALQMPEEELVNVPAEENRPTHQ